MDANSPRSIIMFQIGDLVEYQMGSIKIIGFIESIIDGKVGVRYLNAHEFGVDKSRNELIVYTNPLDYLRKIDKLDEEVP
jgi:hypothetical protein